MGAWTGTVPTFAAGAKLRGADMQTISDILTATTAAWTSYTPVWTANGTAVSLGNGTIVGKYRQVGKWVTAQILLTMGSTTTFGTSFYLFTLPVTALTANGYLGAAKFLDAGTLDRNGVSYLFDTTHVVATSNAGAAGQLVPHTWANTDTFTIQIDYEAP